MGNNTSINYNHSKKCNFTSLDIRIHLEFQIIKGKLKESEVKENNYLLD